MEARVDFERFPNAAKLLRNMVLFPQGGAARRPGTRFVKEVKTSSLSTKLIPFEFSETDSYMMEAGNNYLRVYRRQGAITVADTDAAVTNGTFTSNITSWTDASTGTAAIAHDATSPEWERISADMLNLNIVVRHNLSDSSAFNKIIGGIEQSVRAVAGEDMNVQFVGKNLMVNRSAEGLIENQADSLIWRF